MPKGVLNLRDEMAGWLLNLSRYSNGGSDRPFWLEAYSGGPHQVDRAKFDVPIFIPHLTIPAFGTIQPERLADILTLPMTVEQPLPVGLARRGAGVPPAH